MRKAAQIRWPRAPEYASITDAGNQTGSAWYQGKSAPLADRPTGRSSVWGPRRPSVRHSRRHAYPVASAGDDGTARALRRPNGAFQVWRGRPARVRRTLAGLGGQGGQLFRCARVGGANRISMASVMRGLEVFAGAG